jgi:dolichol-phosphate mannosyltransferase
VAQYEQDLLTVVIPAHNEEGNIAPVLGKLRDALRDADIRYQIVVVDDNSTDGTRAAVEVIGREDPGVEVVSRTPPPGFGRAIRAGLDHMRGDVVAIFMADDSDDPADLVKCHQIIREGYDCVFGSRFMKGSKTDHYPRLKLVINRIVNQGLRVMFMTRHNDLTNAFKLYRSHVIDACRPYRACHFNITLEMSLGALIRRYSFATVPISWSGRTWGSTKLRLREMGRRYLHTILVMFLNRTLVADDLPHKGDDGGNT